MFYIFIIAQPDTVKRAPGQVMEANASEREKHEQTVELVGSKMLFCIYVQR